MTGRGREYIPGVGANQRQEGSIYQKREYTPSRLTIRTGKSNTQAASAFDKGPCCITPTRFAYDEHTTKEAIHIPQTRQSTPPKRGNRHQ
eukprot:9487794-Pyramimonas_sp.AAC.1